MTTHATNSFNSHPHHQTLYSNRTYARTTTTTTRTTSPHSSTINRPFQSYLKTLPQINTCENLLYDVTVAGDVGSATSSSYINSSDHYDNTYINTYDNPIQYFENYPSKSIDIVKRSLIDLPKSHENLYDHARVDNDDDDENDSSTSPSTSPVLFYLENKNLAICACIISLLLLLLIGLGIFLLNKLIRPVIINTTVNNHYSIMNMSNATTTTLMPFRSTVPTPLAVLLRRSSIDILTTTTAAAAKRTTTTTTTMTTTSSTLLTDDFTFSCPPDRWGNACENICKPCGLGVCHPTTGKCICPTDIYGEFCDLWRVNDKPKRGDMMS